MLPLQLLLVQLLVLLQVLLRVVVVLLLLLLRVLQLLLLLLVAVLLLLRLLPLLRLLLLLFVMVLVVVVVVVRLLLLLLLIFPCWMRRMPTEPRKRDVGRLKVRDLHNNTFWSLMLPHCCGRFGPRVPLACGRAIEVGGCRRRVALGARLALAGALLGRNG